MSWCPFRPQVQSDLGPDQTQGRSARVQDAYFANITSATVPPNVYLKPHVNMSALAFALLATIAASPQNAAQPRLVDAMPAFFEAYEQTASQGLPDQVAALRRLVLQPYSAAYHGQRSDDDQALGDYLVATKPYLPLIKTVHDEMSNQMVNDVAAFRQQFADFDSGFTIYLMPSLDTFDGAVRDVGNEPGILFGVDELAKMHKTTPVELRVIITHEFVHLYQGERDAELQSALNAAVPPVYASLWSEGLASYISYALTPDATVDDALGSGLANVPDATLGLAACSIKAHLDGATRSEADRYFNGDPSLDTGGLPHRVGYLVGFTIVAKMAYQRSLHDLLALHGPPLHALLAHSLETMCVEK